MPDNVTCEFAVIRLVPKVEREEFMNVGVLLYSRQRKYLGIRYTLDGGKLGALCPDLDLAEIRQYLQAWEAVCVGGSAGGPIGQMDIANRFRWLTASRSTLLQCSSTHPGLCGDPETVLEALYRQYVL